MFVKSANAIAIDVVRRAAGQLSRRANILEATCAEVQIRPRRVFVAHWMAFSVGHGDGETSSILIILPAECVKPR